MPLRETLLKIMTKPNSFSQQLASSAQRLFKLIDNFSSAKILVIGDLTLDEFLTGEVERISREAPVLILRHEKTEQIPGGGANAVYNLAKLGGKIKVAGIIGKDIQGEALLNIFAAARIDTRGIIIAPNQPTVTKTRIAAHARQSVTQQIVRVDRKSDEVPDLDIQQSLESYIRSELATVDAVVCSDYGDGALTEPTIRAGLSHHRILVDAQKDLHRYTGATIFTPNLPEAEQAVGYSMKDNQSLLQGGRDLLQLTQAQHILITRGEEGMSLFSHESGGIQHRHIPPFNRTNVFDVTGAGDTVVAALTLSLCAGASFWEGAVLGNLAASIVVRKFGTATTTQEEMKEALQILLKEI